MAFASVVISSGHGKYVRGASGIIDEVDEARKVVDAVAPELQKRGVTVKSYHDNVSHSQNENLNRIVDYHNAQSRELDISVHFNAYEQVSKPMGTEVLYVTQSTLAGQVSSAIAACGFINRGPKKRTDLFFLNNTTKPAILIETCFVDSEADVSVYKSHFAAVIDAICDVIGGDDAATQPPPPGEAHNLIGRCSMFGGPDDMGVSADEGLAFISDVMQAPHLFLPYQPEGTTGLARRLNAKAVNYIACRWDYEDTSRDMLRREVALVRATKTGVTLKAFPADWGPHEDTGRVADISPALMDSLGIETDGEVEVIFPYREDSA